MQHDDRHDIDDSKRAVVVLGHGSRAADSGQPLEWVAGQLDKRLGCRVTSAFLQFNQPNLSQCCRELAADGVLEVFIATYFLFQGNHMMQDIPEEISELSRDFPEISFTLTSTLGTDENLVQLLVKRLREAGFASGRGKDPGSPQHPIERESFTIIDDLVKPEDADDPRYMISRRVVHATGDVSLADGLSFSTEPIAAAMDSFASSGAVYCDVNMVAAGVEPTAERAGLKVICGIADTATNVLATAEGITRGAAAFRRNYIDDRSSFEGAIVVVGNAPTALYELLRLAREDGVRPALVVGVPVGFVGAAESKDELAASDLEFITMPGNRGGSNVAAAVVNALIKMWTESGEQA